jgi:hypothetical protein
MTEWWLEFENGERSTPYATEAEAWAALVDLQSREALANPQYSRPMWLVSSDGKRFPIFRKNS